MHTLKQCNGTHCRCMESDCTNFHYADCESRITDLEKEIEYEQVQYDIACEHPTETAQFYKGLENTRVKIVGLKQKLEDLKNKL